MLNTIDRVKQALTRYFDQGDWTDLQTLISADPNLCTAPQGGYPDVHRIADIKIGTQPYRVLRHVSDNERLALVSIDEPNYEQPGVPLWLEGPQLKRWVLDEEAEPSDGPIDWQKYKP